MNKTQKDSEVRSQKIVHLQIGDEHTYYGSIKAMVESVGEEALGIKERKMRDMRISQFPSYITPSGAIIRIGRLTTTQKRKKQEK